MLKYYCHTSKYYTNVHFGKTIFLVKDVFSFCLYLKWIKACVTTIRDSQFTVCLLLGHIFFILGGKQLMKKHTKSRIFIILLIIASTFVMVSCSENPDNCTHSWGAPTCLEPAQCYKCDTYKPDGKLGNHNYSAATCREPAKCIYCYQYKDDNLGTHEFSIETGYCYYCGISRDNSNNTNNACENGHTDGEWTITKSSTLISNGTEELLCSVCGKLLDSRVIQKKSPQVEGDHFNFTDQEFIEWFNKNDSYKINNAELGEYGDDSPFTSYKITFSDGEIGTIMLSHGDVNDDIIDKSGYITGIYVEAYISNSAATVIWIGKEINSKFDYNDAINKLLADKSYISANMCCNLIEFTDDIAIAYLEPYQ